MKKRIALFLSLIMTLSALASIPVFADAAEKSDEIPDTFDLVNNSLDLVPDDCFEGDYEEFANKDGSKTCVFKNGSVITEYKDGTQEGFDYKGNHHYLDRDNNATVMIKDGTLCTESADGRKTVTLPGGMRTVVINPDHSSSEISQYTGTVREFDKEGRCTGIGFVGSDERIGTDESGDFKDGEISGPNGASLSIRENGSEISLVSPNGTTFDYKETGEADSGEGQTESYTVKKPDGKEISWDVTVKLDRDKETGESVGKTVEALGGVYYPSGEKVEFEEKMRFDKTGAPYRSANNVAQWTGADGKTLWIDKNSGALRYSDPVSGDKIVVDPAGNLTEFKSGKAEFQAEFNPDGGLKTAYYKMENGAEITIDNGSGKVVLPSGDVYEVDESGNITKNGEIIRQDGVWATDSSDAGKKNESNDLKDVDAKHWAGTYDAVMTQGGLSSETGKSYWIYVQQDETTGQLKVTTPQNSVMTDYDPKTHTACGVYAIDGVDYPITVVFSEEKGVRHMIYTFEWTGVRTEIYEGDEVNGKK